MKKLVLPVFLFVMLSPAVLAQYGMMGNYGSYGGGMFWAGILGLVYLAVGSFVFAVIFWLTHNWLVKRR